MRQTVFYTLISKREFEYAFWVVVSEHSLLFELMLMSSALGAEMTQKKFKLFVSGPEKNLTKVSFNICTIVVFVYDQVI